MTREARLTPGIILITMPTIQYGGYFLLVTGIVFDVAGGAVMV
jgi:hypothetical protein